MLGGFVRVNGEDRMHEKLKGLQRETQIFGRSMISDAGEITER